MIRKNKIRIENVRKYKEELKINNNKNREPH